ncbi:hypothetical protein PspLS_01663 [Pyricularia sp. CBS 133598]|nr:hypothetical protein PspLS_01663 [Pyricularia sp. CBS 133598]
MSPRPTSRFKMAIYFPQDSDAPILRWVEIKITQEHSPWLEKLGLIPNMTFTPDFEPFLGLNHDVLWTMPFNCIRRREFQLDHDLTIYYRDHPSPRNRSVHAAAGTQFALPFRWGGPIVVLRGKSRITGYEDVSLADYRFAVDYMATYFDNEVREDPRAGDLRGVRVNCLGQKMLHGASDFNEVGVSRDFPANFEISHSSRLLELPVRGCILEAQYDNGENITELADVGQEPLARSSSYNPKAAALFFHLGLSNPTDKSQHLVLNDNNMAQVVQSLVGKKGPSWGKGPSCWNGENTGHVLLLRQDEKDLTVKQVELLCEFACDVVGPIIADLQGKGKGGDSESISKLISPDTLADFRQRLSSCERIESSTKPSDAKKVRSRGAVRWSGRDPKLPKSPYVRFTEMMELRQSEYAKKIMHWIVKDLAKQNGS